MKKRQVWRYACEFCKKSGCSAHHIATHERSCTANPQRICEMHKHCEEPQRPIVELIAALRSHEQEDGLDYTRGLADLRTLASDCPACILAAIRQSVVQKQTNPGSEFGENVRVDFDFKKELAEFWRDVNDSQSMCC